MVMEPYKVFYQWQWADDSPFRPDWYVCGSVYVSGAGTSIAGVTRFQVQRFTVDIKELAEWFGLKLARIVVDECLSQQEYLWRF
jgi:hypothetical protein